MHKHDITVISERKIGFEEALAGFVVGTEGFVRIGIVRAVDAAHSMSDIRTFFDPGIVKIVRFGVARYTDDFLGIQRIPRNLAIT